MDLHLEGLRSAVLQRCSSAATNDVSARPSGQSSFTAVPEALTISMLLPTVS
jgi:hypothetical protein